MTDWEVHREVLVRENCEQAEHIAELERVNAEYMDINHEQGMQLIEKCKRIAELENAYNLLQSQFDVTRERWMKRGAFIAEQRERIAELEKSCCSLQGAFDLARYRWMKRGNYIEKQQEQIEKLKSLALDMYESLWTVSESWAYDAYHERMAELGLTEVER